MVGRARSALLASVFVQAAHSLEEYFTRLWEVFPPARLLTSAVSDDLELGFIVVNTSVVAFGALCFTTRWRGLIWMWTVMELINGSGHLVWAVWAGSYVSGLATAPVLLALAAILAFDLARE